MLDDSVVMGKKEVPRERRCVDGGEGARDIWGRIKQHWCFEWDGVEGSRTEVEMRGITGVEDRRWKIMGVGDKKV